jgi:hypothetical protein
MTVPKSLNLVVFLHIKEVRHFVVSSILSRMKVKVGLCNRRSPPSEINLNRL